MQLDYASGERVGLDVNILHRSGALGEIRTPDPQIRSLSVAPATGTPGSP
jgi:hypothetical protein